MNRYNFVCVNFNGSKFCSELLVSLELLEKNQQDKIRLIIVDNDSSDLDLKSIHDLSSEKLEVIIIENDCNIGYFPALNVGIEYIKMKEEDGCCDNIIVGNNDLQYHKDFITQLDLCSYDSNVLIIAPNVVTIDGVHQNPLSTRRYTPTQIFFEDIYYSNYYVSRVLIWCKKILSRFLPKKNLSQSLPVSAGEIQRGIGACYILTARFFDFYSKLDDRVFMWGEEALLANQVSAVNGIIYYNPLLGVTHAESGTVKKMLTKDRYEIVKKSYKIYREYL